MSISFIAMYRAPRERNRTNKRMVKMQQITNVAFTITGRSLSPTLVYVTLMAMCGHLVLLCSIDASYSVKWVTKIAIHFQGRGVASFCTPS